MSILVVGSVAYDTVETPQERRERQLGGSASYFAVAARHMGDVRIVGVVGEDFRQADLDLLVECGADIGGIQHAAGPSFHWSGRYHEDLIERDTLATELGVFADFRPEIPASWCQSEYLFLANIHPALQSHVLAGLAEPRLIVLDTMNLWIETTRAELEQVLARVDVLLLNDSEARLLTGERSLAAAARAIQALGPRRVVVKKGEHGALYFGLDSVLAVPAIFLPEVVDPTGAGDCFAGGFVSALAAVGATRDDPDREFRRAMLAGTATASFCPEGFSVEGLLGMTVADYQERMVILENMMTP